MKITENDEICVPAVNRVGALDFAFPLLTGWGSTINRLVVHSMDRLGGPIKERNIVL